VYAYNTDAGGYYAHNGRNYPPRLHGWMQTDASGRYELHTIRPGHYPGMQIPAHIHFNLWGAGYPRQWVEELRFEGDPLVTAAMREQAAAAGQFTTIQPVRRAGDGVWHATFHMRVSRTSNF
jgi:protocatechuate 3,4-dioxygenase beta subunit